MSHVGRVGDLAVSSCDTHGRACCPHSVEGPAKIGSSDVLVNGRSALRIGDKGMHVGCCGANTWTAVEGSQTVIVNDRFIHRKGDDTSHCGGVGHLASGSPNVFAGESERGTSITPEPRYHWICLDFEVSGRRLHSTEAEIRFSDRGTRASLDSLGTCELSWFLELLVLEVAVEWEFIGEQ